jgi:peroxiredoxin
MSSSATTEANEPVGPATRARPPRTAVGVPVSLLVAGVLSVLLVVVGVLALLSSTTGTPRARPSLVGQTVRPFSLERVDTRGRVAAPWRSRHPTLVVWFARWCTVCATEVPRLARELGTGHLGDVRVLGIDDDPQPAVAQAFVHDNHVAFPVGLDPNQVVAYGLGFAALPDSIFVSATGRVIAVDFGVLSDRELAAGLAELRTGASRT